MALAALALPQPAWANHVELQLDGIALSRFASDCVVDNVCPPALQADYVAVEEAELGVRRKPIESRDENSQKTLRLLDTDFATNHAQVIVPLRRWNELKDCENVQGCRTGEGDGQRITLYLNVSIETLVRTVASAESEDEEPEEEEYEAICFTADSISVGEGGAEYPVDQLLDLMPGGADQLAEPICREVPLEAIAAAVPACDEPVAAVAVDEQEQFLAVRLGCSSDAEQLTSTEAADWESFLAGNIRRLGDAAADWSFFLSRQIFVNGVLDAFAAAVEGNPDVTFVRDSFSNWQATDDGASFETQTRSRLDFWACPVPIDVIASVELTEGTISFDDRRAGANAKVVVDIHAETKTNQAGLALCAVPLSGILGFGDLGIAHSVLHHLDETYLSGPATAEHDGCVLVADGHYRCEYPIGIPSLQLHADSPAGRFVITDFRGERASVVDTILTGGGVAFSGEITSLPVTREPIAIRNTPEFAGIDLRDSSGCCDSFEFRAEVNLTDARLCNGDNAPCSGGDRLDPCGITINPADDPHGVYEVVLKNDESASFIVRLAPHAGSVDEFWEEPDDFRAWVSTNRGPVLVNIPFTLEMDGADFRQAMASCATAHRLCHTVRDGTAPVIEPELAVRPEDPADELDTLVVVPSEEPMTELGTFTVTPTEANQTLLRHLAPLQN